MASFAKTIKESDDRYWIKQDPKNGLYLTRDLQSEQPQLDGNRLEIEQSILLDSNENSKRRCLFPQSITLVLTEHKKQLCQLRVYNEEEYIPRFVELL